MAASRKRSASGTDAAPTATEAAAPAGPGGAEVVLAACAGILASVRTTEGELRRVTDPFLNLPQKRRVARASLAAGGVESLATTPLVVERRSVTFAPAVSAEPAGGPSREELEALVQHHVQMAVVQALRERSNDLREAVDQSVRAAAAGQEGRLLDVLTRNLTESLKTLEAQVHDRIAEARPAFPSAAPVEFSPDELEDVRSDEEEARAWPVSRDTASARARPDGASLDLETSDPSADLAPAVGSERVEIHMGAEIGEISEPAQEPVHEPADTDAAAEADAIAADLAAAAPAAEEPLVEIGMDIEARVAAGANPDLLDAIEDVRTLDVHIDPVSFELEGFAEVIKGESLGADGSPDTFGSDDEPLEIGAMPGDDDLAAAASDAIVSLDAGDGGDGAVLVDLSAGVGEDGISVANLPADALQTDAPGMELRVIDEEGETIDLPPAGARGPSPEEVDTVNRYLELAAELRARKNYPAALEVYGKVLEIDPRNFDAYVGRGVLHLETADLPRAATEFKKAQAIDPQAPEAYMGMGEIHFVRKEYPKAIKAFTRSLSLDENLADAYYKRGLSHYHERGYKKAFLDLNKAYQLDPELPHIKKYLQMVMKQLRPGN